MKIIRYMYRIRPFKDSKIFSNLDEIKSMVDKKELLTFSLFEYEQANEYFVYVETNGSELDTKKLFKDFTSWEVARMYKVFHYVYDLEVDEWQKDRLNPKGKLKLIKLQPDMIGSYIYYHYRLQEEIDEERLKYCSIFINEDLIAMYGEDPGLKYYPKFQGKFDTKTSPRDSWHELMKDHFAPLSDEYENWMPIKTIASYF